MFALEVPHRMGLEYYEAVPFALASGMLCLAVFRALAGTHFGQLWPFLIDLEKQIDVRHIILGVALGVLGAAVAAVWAKFTKASRMMMKRLGFDEHATPIKCGLLGGMIVGFIGFLLPPTMFWGEFELRSFADPKNIPLPHIWPQSGIWGDVLFLPTHNTPWMYALIGVAKLFATTVTLLAGFRGGFIFPLMAAGASMGISLHMVATSLASEELMASFPLVLWAMCMAAAVNCAVTRTPLATPLILCALSGQGSALVPCLAAALTSLFLTKDVVVICSQAPRSEDDDEACDDAAAAAMHHPDVIMPPSPPRDHLHAPLLQPHYPDLRYGGRRGYTESI
jgi:H+/Cl- antiporter ClcA